MLKERKRKKEEHWYVKIVVDKHLGKEPMLKALAEYSQFISAVALHLLERNDFRYSSTCVELDSSLSMCWFNWESNADEKFLVICTRIHQWTISCFANISLEIRSTINRIRSMSLSLWIRRPGQGLPLYFIVNDTEKYSRNTEPCITESYGKIRSRRSY